MRTKPQPEPHLDADQLAAFTEGALPASERTLCLQHLAECAHCREVAFLAGAALPEEEPASAPSRGFSLAWWSVLSLGAATLAAVVITVALLHHGRQSAASTPVQMASRPSLPPVPQATTAPINQPAPAQTNPRAPAKPSPAQKTPPKPQVSMLDERQAADAVTAAPPAPAAAASPQPAAISGGLASGRTLAPPAGTPAQAQSALGLSAGSAKAAPTATLRAYSPAYMGSPGAPPGIAGTITDSSGATIPHAKVTLDQASGATHRETLADDAGHFTIGSLQPGKYRLEISSPGFMSQVREVEVGTSQLAEVDSKLAVGAVSETVEVQSAAPALNTESVSVQSMLPDKKPLQTSVTDGTRMLALDPDGKLFLRKKAGKHWKAVNGPWRNSAITSLSLTPDQGFKVTSAEGSWVSADGERWQSTN